MRVSSQVAVGSPTFRLVTLAAITMALVLAAAGAVAVGASLVPTSLPQPFGLAKNGSLVYGDAGDIWVVDASGANGRAMITGPENDHDPVYSHDGTKFAFARDDSTGGSTLMVARADGTNVVPLTTTDFTWADWSPDDQQLALSHNVDHRMVISIVNADGGGDTRTLDLGGIDPTDWVAWRPTDGQELIFRGHPSAADPNVALYMIGSDGSSLRAITPSVPDAPAYGDPAVSPDGSTVGYWTWGPDSSGQVDGWGHLLDLATGTDLLSTEYGGGSTAFSPDSDWVVGGGRDQLVIVPSHGSQPTRNIGPAYTGQPIDGFAFSPDGTKVYMTFGTPGATSVIDVVTGTTAPMTQPIPNYPSWQRLAP